MIGLIPIGGSAQRFNGIPKFLLPVGEGTMLSTLQHRLLDSGANRLIMGVNARYLDLVIQPDPAPCYAFPVATETMSETVLLARPYCGETESVLFGMPDTYWTDKHVYSRLAQALKHSLVSAALWEVHGESYKHGMVGIGIDNSILDVQDKPIRTHHTLAWGAMAWNADFWAYIQPEDPHVGYALQRAVEAGEHAAAVVCDGPYWNCGTAEDYFDLIRKVTHPQPIEGA